MLRRKDNSGKEYVLGGEMFYEVAREGHLAKVMFFEKDLEAVRKLWIWEECSRQRGQQEQRL